MSTKPAIVSALAAGAAFLGFFAVRALRRRDAGHSPRGYQNAPASLTDTRDIPLAIETGDYLVLDLEEIFTPPSVRGAHG